MRSDLRLYRYFCDGRGCSRVEYFLSIKEARGSGWLIKNDSYRVYCPVCRFLYDFRGRPRSVENEKNDPKPTPPPSIS